MVTMQEIAEKANVSRATVSRVLSGSANVKPETKERVLYWIKKTNFQPNLVAQGLIGSRTKLIGVLIPNLSNPFYANIVEAIEEEAYKCGYSIVLYCTHKDEKQEKNMLNILKSRRVDGILTIPVDSTRKKDNYADVDVPVVVFTKFRENISGVYVSQADEVKKVMAHFWERGAHSIGYVGPVYKKNGSKQKKYIGFEQFINEKNIKPADVIDCRQSDDMEDRVVFQTVCDYIKNNGINSRALFVHNDMAARDTIDALEACGYRVPEDVAVSGFDNTILCVKAAPYLTSVDHPLHEIGRQALNLLIRMLKDEIDECVHIKVDSRLVIRESSNISAVADVKIV